MKRGNSGIIYRSVSSLHDFPDGQKYFKKKILPILPKPKRGYECKVPLFLVVNAILYKLKTGCQWRMLPVESLFPGMDYSWKSVYYHFQKWAKSAVWEQVWIEVLSKHKAYLDMSNIELDGSHTPVKRGGSAVAYQGRKKAKTTNMLLLPIPRAFHLLVASL